MKLFGNEQVCAEEPSVMVKFEREEEKDRVRITFLDMSSDKEVIYFAATISGWRWERVVRTLEMGNIE